MEKDSEILEKLNDLEREMSLLSSRLEPVLVARAQSETSDPTPARSQVNARLTVLIGQFRDLQSRLEL